MMDIKFRAWDKELKQMLFRGVFDRNWYATEYNDKNGSHCARGIHTNDRHSLELMQYTGLKDKNSKDIYEGDIMINNGGCQVIFETGGFIARSKAFFIIPSYFWNCEVVGNIYENADLLN